MRAENLQPATLDECNRVLEALPDLTAPGFDSYYAACRERKNARRALEGLPAEVRPQPTPITDPEVREQIPSARLFLRHNYQQTKTVRRGIGTSYGLKHEAERWAGTYICNGALIAAACLEGCLIERDGPNAYFSLSPTREYRRALRGGY
jgi:hypothetical protein